MVAATIANQRYKERKGYKSRTRPVETESSKRNKHDDKLVLFRCLQMLRNEGGGGEREEEKK
jgi:hypothetical protein